jgi:hypothetical protein
MDFLQQDRAEAVEVHQSPLVEAMVAPEGFLLLLAAAAAHVAFLRGSLVQVGQEPLGSQ